MEEFIKYGTLAGAMVGALHCAQIIASRRRQPGTGIVKMLWHAVWIWALWTLFGAYVLALWMIAAALYLLLGRASARASRR